MAQAVLAACTCTASFRKAKAPQAGQGKTGPHPGLSRLNTYLPGSTRGPPDRCMLKYSRIAQSLRPYRVVRLRPKGAAGAATPYTQALCEQHAEPNNAAKQQGAQGPLACASCSRTNSITLSFHTLCQYSGSTSSLNGKRMSGLDSWGKLSVVAILLDGAV